MLLRPYSPADLGVVHAINQAEAPAVGSVTPDEFAHVAAQSAIALVAVDDDSDAVAGFCLVLAPGAEYASGNYAWFSDRYDDFVYLDRIAIAPAFQRRGIGRAMYAEVDRLARELRPDATDFCLEVNLRPRNDGSLAFHDRLGFTEVGQRETDYGARVSMQTRPLA